MERRNFLSCLGWGIKAGVLTSPSAVVYLAVVSVVWCLLSKQKMWFVS